MATYRCSECGGRFRHNLSCSSYGCRDVSDGPSCQYRGSPQQVQQSPLLHACHAAAYTEAHVIQMLFEENQRLGAQLVQALVLQPVPPIIMEMTPEMWKWVEGQTASQDFPDRLRGIERQRIQQIKVLAAEVRSKVVIPLCKKYNLSFRGGALGQCHFLQGAEMFRMEASRQPTDIAAAFNVLRLSVGTEEELGDYVENYTEGETNV